MLQRIAFFAGLSILATYLIFTLCSLRSFTLDFDEANILSIAAASLHGQPVYHSLHSPDASYAYQYGPMTFLIYRTAMVFGQGAFWVLRVPVVLANIFFCLALLSTLRKFVNWQMAVALMAFPLCAMMHYVNCSLGLRADIWILLALALALRCSLMERPWLAILLTGVFGGLAVNFKVPAVLGFSLILVMIFRRFGVKAAIVTLITGTATALAPFAIQNISLKNYLAWVGQSGKTGPDPHVMPFCFFYAIFLLLPLLALRWAGLPIWPSTSAEGARRFTFVEPTLFALCLFAGAFVSSKVGAGPYHLWQLLPIVSVYVATSIAARRRADGIPLRLDYALCVLAVTSTVFGLAFIKRDMRNIHVPTPAEAADLSLGRQELQRNLDLYRGRTLQVGYGPTPRESAEMLRYIPVFHGQPYTLDGAGRLEAWMLPFPANIPKRMINCTDDVWMIPHGESPFDGYFYFPPALHGIFLQHYDLQEQGAIYDVWVCKAAKR